ILNVDDSGIHVATGDGALILEELQLPGKRRMAVADLLRGNPDLFQVGEPLGDSIDNV
ncbi:MAG TPA: methionyl-tRNA formyltransferase, partial [Alcanivorax sp.]|nr:methionyl-tRNA formyltransferase [Alcanivorax sp.]